MNSNIFFKAALFSGVICALLLSASCKKEEEEIIKNPPLSTTPAIEIKDVSPTTVQQYEDSIIITIFYKDGDGDLGHPDADSAVAYVTDNRVPFTETYHVPPLAPVGDSVAIQGHLQIVLNNTALIDNTSGETTTYTIKLKDRSGKWSNEATTGTITITP